MKVLIYRTEGEAKRQTAQRLLRKIQLQPKSVLGLATGETMESVYAHLVKASQNHSASWAQVSTFNLDEYWGISADNPASYRKYMNFHLFNRTDINLERTHLPASDGSDPQAAAKRYEGAIAAAGGIDLQLLGIGNNGHIGFNEPTSSLSSKTRIKTLTEETRRANQRFFDCLDDVPQYAITVGIGTILRSRECLLVGTGTVKASAVAAMIEGPVSASCPASALQLHANVTVVIDQDAASELKLQDYYQHVHPGARDEDFNAP